MKKITQFIAQFNMSTSRLHPKAHGIDEHLKGESSHHIHFHENQQHSHPWPPKLDMYKFGGSSLTLWVAQMEQYFILNDIRDDTTKLHVGALYLDQERWQWWQWHHKCYPGNITLQVFSKSSCDRFDRESNFLGCLIEL